ncbi:hypothetical protein BGZ95_005409 [Linnemannia exigua]|uniref:Extracellular solute-binding protein n=1 Tax=Linnemannia exigua TaxID=604196 RepID=A0AAD4HBF7_9FUNG|nr:hypothetical protein BGZ95_005409 [Linnemannia exigua]
MASSLQKQEQETQCTLKIAVVGGPQYDRLYDRLAVFEAETGVHVEIVYRGSHPELNDFITATFPPANTDHTHNSSYKTPELDLISTHVKYAPSQAHYLQELDSSLVSQEQQDEFLDSALEACKIQGKLMQLPRMVDSRVLFYREDVLEKLGLAPPKTWQELLQCASTIGQAALPLEVGGQSVPRLPNSAVAEPKTMQGYVFPGKLSGLFGTFYELAMMEMRHPEALFDRNDRPVFEESTVVPVLTYMRQLVATGAVPADIDQYYFDQVSTMFTEGQVAMVADWPSYYRDMKQLLLKKAGEKGGGAEVKVMRYPVGANGSRSAYSGMHSFAIPKSCRHLQKALRLLQFLVHDDQQWLEATESGSFPTKKAVLQRLVNETEEAVARSSPSVGVERTTGSDSRSDAQLDSERLGCLRATVEEDMAMFPHLLTYPELEDALYPMIQDAMMGRLSPKEAARRMQTRALQTF